MMSEYDYVNKRRPTKVRWQVGDDVDLRLLTTSLIISRDFINYTAINKITRQIHNSREKLSHI